VETKIRTAIARSSPSRLRLWLRPGKRVLRNVPSGNSMTVPAGLEVFKGLTSSETLFKRSDPRAKRSSNVVLFKQSAPKEQAGSFQISAGIWKGQ